MKNQHTPGPWEVKSKKMLLGNKGPLCIISRKEQVKIVCEIGAHSSLENHANANLIASAPDLLEALRFLVADYIAIEGEKLTGSSVPLEMARAAILKAEGLK